MLKGFHNNSSIYKYWGVGQEQCGRRSRYTRRWVDVRRLYYFFPPSLMVFSSPVRKYR